MGQSVPSPAIQTPGNVFVEYPSKLPFRDIYTVAVLDGDRNGRHSERWINTTFIYQSQVREGGHHLPTMFSVCLSRDTSDDLCQVLRSVTSK